MRLILATVALMLAACAAEPEADAQINSVEELLAEIRKDTEDGGGTIRETDCWGTQDKATLCSDDKSVIETKKAQLSKLERLLNRKDDFENLTVKEQTTLVAETEKLRSEVEVVQRLPRLGEKLTCHGIVKQGGLVVCQTTPNAKVEVGRAENDTYTQTAGPDGRLIVGFDRDEPNAFIRVGEQRVDFEITKRDYDTSRIDGLPKNMVSEYTADELKRIRKASALKKVGFASMVEEIGFKDGFIYPVTTHTKTTNFGAQRILNGDPKRPHFGVDLAAPKGTPILAPADGIVSLASEEMYFEGSLIMIDHGQGLISYYLHNEDVMVEDGERVVQGQQIGTVGSRGRSTGPHLCWRLKWRGRNLDPELLTEWPTDG